MNTYGSLGPCTVTAKWDVFDGSDPVIFAGSRDGLWEPVSRKIVDASDLAVPVWQD